jgi:hypothetical protein
MIMEILFLVTVSVISGVKSVTFSKVHTSSGIETESVNRVLLLHADNSKVIKTQNRNVYLFIPSVIEPSVFPFIILALRLTLAGLNIKPGKTIIFQEIFGCRSQFKRVFNN